MENKSSENRRTAHANRFSDSTGGAARRTAASARARAAGAQGGHRPSGFAPAAPQKRRPEAKPAPKKAKAKIQRSEKREKPLRNKRTQPKRSFAPWQKALMIGIPALAVLLVIFVLIFGGGNGTYHQLPKVERGSSSAFTPDETNVPEEANMPEAFGAFGGAAAFDDSAFDESDFDASAFDDAAFDASAFDASGDLEGFLGGADNLGDLEDFDGEFDFGEGGDFDDALMQQFLASEGAGT